MIEDMTGVERDIVLSVLLVGDSLPSTIADVSGRHPRSVSRSIPDVLERGYIVEKNRSVYALTPIGYSVARRILSERVDQD